MVIGAGGYAFTCGGSGGGNPIPIGLKKSQKVIRRRVIGGILANG